MTPLVLTRLARRALLATSALAMCGATWAQKFPDRPIKLLVPFAVGGGTDILAREISPKLGELLAYYHDDNERSIPHAGVGERRR